MWREPDTSAVLPLPTNRQIRRLLIWRSSPAESLAAPGLARAERAVRSPSVTQRAQRRPDRRIDSRDGCDAVRAGRRSDREDLSRQARRSPDCPAGLISDPSPDRRPADPVVYTHCRD